MHSQSAGEGRTVLVTGGNRGLGLETCRQLAERGWRVLLSSRDVAAGQAAADRLARKGLAVEHRPLDVAESSSITALVDGLGRDGLTIDVLVNNAGIAMNGFNAEVARRTLDVNFFGALELTDALLPHLPDQGSIVMVSSGVGELAGLDPAMRERFTDPRLTREGLVVLMRSFVSAVEQGRHEQAGWPSSAYRVSKVGLNALVRLMAPELKPRGIRVNAVCPGWVRTDMGGARAARSVKKGAESIVWAALLEDDTTGGFFRDGVAIPW